MPPSSTAATLPPVAAAPGQAEALAARARRIGLVWSLAAAAVYALDLYQQTRAGLTNGAGRPFGDDFINYWSAGRLTLLGRAGEVYHGPALHGFQQGVVGGAIQAYHFSYPPLALLLLAPLGLIPYAPALLAWLTLSGALFWRSLRLAAGRAALPLALATPALFINAVGGQNGAWTAALLGGGLSLIDRRPWLAGVLFGLLIYKPQLGLLIPLALVAGRRWKTLGAASLVAGGLIGLSLIAFGAGAWSDYLRNLTLMRQLELEDGAGVWHRMVSVFVFARRLGAPVGAAYAVQAVSALAAAGVVAAPWLRNASLERRGLALVLGACLATPYLQDYDLVVLAFAATWLAAPAFRGEDRGRSRLIASISLLILPLVAAPLGKLTGLSLGALFFLPAVTVVLRGEIPKPAPLAG